MVGREKLEPVGKLKVSGQGLKTGLTGGVCSKEERKISSWTTVKIQSRDPICLSGMKMESGGVAPPSRSALTHSCLRSSSARELCPADLLSGD